MGNIEELEGLKETMGACRYCGQMQVLHTADDIDVATADDMATEKCDCAEAEHDRNIRKKKETARVKINRLFADSRNGRTVPEETLDILYKAADMVVDGLAAGITVNYGMGLKCTIKAGSKNVTVEKKEEKQTKESV